MNETPDAQQPSASGIATPNLGDPVRARRGFLQKWPLAYIGIACVAMALIVALALWLMRGSYLELTGAVENVRTLASDETHSILIVDFRVSNKADGPWVVRQVQLSITDSAGAVKEGTTVAELDARRIFEYYPQLGAKIDTLLPKEALAGHQTKQRMIAAQFDIPEAELKKRKGLKVAILELDGAHSEIAGL